MFFWMYLVIELLAMFLDSGIIPMSNPAYPWFAAIYTGLVAATYTCLLINGFVGFQFAEDGTPLSLWFLRISCLAIWGLCFFLAIASAPPSAEHKHRYAVNPGGLISSNNEIANSKL
ncbi:hypothetical protein D9611_000834 [Ephemerocybe angulata]|uniref:Chitin synthase export chaperone n=1 Tax=Ephemerocybe angulata TaxID=980116 RepID=A0A8H5F7K8_9AGAR|nr:hypothetical protein D9611_000834 [Tulosesus angulatus]